MNSSLLRLNTYWYMLITVSGCGMSLTLCMDKTVPDIINTFFLQDQNKFVNFERVLLPTPP